jgi:hypothetical protein
MKAKSFVECCNNTHSKKLQNATLMGITVPSPSLDAIWARSLLLAERVVHVIVLLRADVT